MTDTSISLVMVDSTTRSDQARMKNASTTEDEGISSAMPLTLQMNTQPDERQDQDQVFMSPQSIQDNQQSHSYGGASFGIQPHNHNNTNIDLEQNQEDQKMNQSLDAPRTSQIRGPNGDMNIMPGAPLLEQTGSQKQFIIKKQQKSKRGNSKGATLMKAYFPNLIAKKDVTLISPNNMASFNSQPPHTTSNQNSHKKPQKFIKMSKSQHGSSISTHQTNSQIRGAQKASTNNANAEIIILADFQNQNNTNSNSQQQVVNGTSDDYQRLSHQQQNHIGDQMHLPLRKQRSQARSGIQENQENSMSAKYTQKRIRRNSFVAAENGNINNESHVTNRSMLPPIFSGPGQKNSHKTRQLQPQQQVRASMQQQQHYMSESSPLRFNYAQQQQQQYSVEQQPKQNSELLDATKQVSSTDRQQNNSLQLLEGHKSGQVYEIGSASVPHNSRKVTKEIAATNNEEVRSPSAGDQVASENDNPDIEERKQPVVNVFNKNQEKLRQMQEQRVRELKDIEDQRAKVLRRQEKLKQNVLKDAQAYKQRKAEREIQLQQKQVEEIKLGNIKKNENGLCVSPKREGHRPSKSITSPMAARLHNNPLQAHAAQKSMIIEPEKTEEEKAEEKKKLDVMRKLYRNRHSSFLQALALQKQKKEAEEQAILEKQEKKKMKVKQKAVGDGSRIRSKVFETPAGIKEDLNDNNAVVPTALANLNSKNFNSTSKSTTATTPSNTKKNMQRGNSVSSLTQIETKYNGDSSNFVSSAKKGNPGSRGSTRAASSKGNNSESQTAGLANRSAQNFNRGRTLTPKVQGSKAKEVAQQPMSPDEQLQFDEKREEEILKQAADKKARAEAIRARQDKQLAAIREKVAKEKEKGQAEIDRQNRIRQHAREMVVQRAEQIKNLPSLREQQDSRMKKRRSDDDDKVGVLSPTPAKPKPPLDPEAFNHFLERNKTMKQPTNLNITDMKEWKKKNRVDPDTKVFIIKGGYKDIRTALKNRGWVHNKDPESPCFDLMWTLKTNDIKHGELLPNQVSNHFQKAASITTKVGLTHSLKNLIWYNTVDIDTFYPRCYDLSLGEELEDFIQEFKQLKAVGYLRKYVREMRECYQASGNSDSADIKSSSVSDKILKVAMKVCKHRCRDLDELIDDPNGFEALVNDQEWAILSTDEHTEETLANKKHQTYMLMQEKSDKQLQKPAAAKAALKAKKAAEAKSKKKVKASGVGSGDDDDDDEDDYDQEYDDESDDYGGEDDEDETPVVGPASNAVTNPKKQNKKTDGNSAPATTGPSDTTTVAVADAVDEEEKESQDQVQENAVFAKSNQTEIQKQADNQLGQRYKKFASAVQVLDVLREKYPQFNLDGERNIWILKPAGSSRGRGICLKKDLCEILDMIKFKDSSQAISNQKNGQLYICQKYIENSQIMKARKYDIRQWVLVTDWNPLTIWIYAEPYIRFPAADFDFSKISNRYAHLSNNSVAKNAKKIKITHHIDGNMWDLEEYQNYLMDEYGYDVWEDKLYEQIKSIVINSLESVQDNFESKRGTPFEMFGYDIMVDDDFNCWLIEVNSSPAMDYSTSVTERLVKMVLEDTIKVVVDYGMASAKKQKKVDTGGFECVYKAKRIVDKPMNSFGLNMEVHGKKISKPHLKKY